MLENNKEVAAADTPFIVCGHRGYKAEYPENTIKAFANAVLNGAKVIETDLHISSDGYVVISHDTNTLRTYGVDYEITQTPYYPTLSELLTLQQPSGQMPLFSQTLEWLWSLEDKSIKLMLDVKRDNDPKRIIELVKQEMCKIAPLDEWKSRIIFALWTPDYFDESIKDFEICNVSIDIKATEGFIKTLKEKHDYDLKYISMMQYFVVDHYSSKDLKDLVEKYDLKLWVWTLNNPKFIYQSYSMFNSRLIGFITDNPPLIDRYIRDRSYLTPSVFTWRETFGNFFKNSLYKTFLFFMRRRYNVRPVFLFMHKRGFI